MATCVCLELTDCSWHDNSSTMKTTRRIDGSAQKVALGPLGVCDCLRFGLGPSKILLWLQKDAMVTTWSGLGPSYSVVIALQLKTTREALMATGMAEDMYSVVLATGVGRGPLRGCGS